MLPRSRCGTRSGSTAVRLACVAFSGHIIAAHVMAIAMVEVSWDMATSPSAPTIPAPKIHTLRRPRKRVRVRSDNIPAMGWETTLETAETLRAIPSAAAEAACSGTIAAICLPSSTCITPPHTAFIATMASG